MAARYWGINKGQQFHQVVEQATTPSKDFEFVQAVTTTGTKEDAVLAMEMIAMAILKSTVPAQ
jgi:hypothetical protein